MVASATTIIIMGGFMALFLHAMKMWQQQEIRCELNFDLENALEHVRQDLRLSSLTEFESGKMAFYGTTTGSFSAISIPISVDMDGDGLLESDTNGLIQWNQTIIYHVRPGTPDKLMRTMYSPRYTNATAAQIYSQLASVVNATTDTQVVSCPIPGSSETGTTKIVFENLVSLAFDTPTLLSGYDCYRSSPGYTNYLWGSLVLSGGLHQITFVVTNRNAASVANNIAIDYVRFSASGSARDGELFVPANSHPTNGFYSFSVLPVALSTNVMEAYMGPEWMGQSALIFNLGNSTGSVALNITNDLWCDNNFNDPSYIWSTNCITAVTTNFGAGDVVFVPQKGNTWSASDSGSAVVPDRISEVTAVTNYLYGISSNSDIGTLKLNGCWARFFFERETNSVSCSLLITNARIYNSSGTVYSNITFNNGSNFVMMYPEGPQSTNSDWVPMWEIDKSTNYMVSFETGVAGDRDIDMVIAENGGSPYLNRWQNNGSQTAYSFTSINATWVGPFNYTPDPYFGDIDGDGDYDLFVASSGFRFYRNIGTSRSPAMSYDSTNQPSVGCGCAYPHLAVVDIEGDGDLDLLFRHPWESNLYLFRNNGSPRVPIWAGQANLITGIPTTGNASAPSPGVDAVDIDGDGKKEVFCGNTVDGNLSWWKNMAALPSFSYVMQSSAYLPTNIIPKFINAVPRFVDLDGDGITDLALGGGDGTVAGDNGKVLYYHNSGSLTNAVWDDPVVLATESASLKLAIPAFANLDGDSGAQGNGPLKWQNSAGSILGTINGMNISSIYGLSSVEVGYPRFARFRSGIFDTTKPDPVYGKLNWTEGVDVNDSCDTYVRVRFSDVSDMSDLSESDWVGEGGSTNYFQDNTGNSILAGTGYRYVQYEAMLEVGKGGHIEAHTNNSPPMLRDVTVDWSWLVSADQGSLCDIWTGLGLGPDYGIVSVKVDGQSPVKGIQAKMQIYKAGRTGTNYTSGSMEIWPLNTRK